jgi:YVTN family beta-propeller protein
MQVAAYAATARAAQAEASGIRVGFTVSALKDGTAKVMAGRDAAFAFTLTTGTATPLRGAKPAAWLIPHAPGSALDERQCRRTAANFARGAGLATPALDLNTFYILVLGGDASVSVIDPRIGFGGSRLIGLGTFDATAADWALTPDQAILAVAQPSADQVALLDSKDWSVSARIAVPGAARLALTPDGRQLLVSYRVASDGAEEGGIAIIDLAAPTMPSRIVTGIGPHAIAVDAEGAFAFVTNAGADTASVIDLAAKRVVQNVGTGPRPVALAYSALARRAYAAAEDGRVTVIGSASATPPATIAGPPGISTMRPTPDGRFLLAASAAAGEVIVADTATDRIVQRIAVAGQPDAIGFSDHIVYIRSRASEFVDAFPLDQIGVEGRTPSAIRIGVGQLALGATRAPAAAEVMSPLPGGDGVAIANAGDRAIYYYLEGMAAPSGSFSTYGREPRGVKILDRRLREAEPGVYRTVGRLPRAGTYDVALYIDAPRTVQCFEITIAPDASADAATAVTPVVRDMMLSGTPRAGQPLSLQFRLLDPHTGLPVSTVSDARVVSFAIPGQSAARSVARPFGDGAYQAELNLPQQGNYYVFVEAPSVALAPTAGRLIAITPAIAR